MTDRRPWQRVSLDEQGKLLPVERSSLTAPIQPFEQDPRRFRQEGLHRTCIEGHPVVLDVPTQLRTEYYGVSFNARALVADVLQRICKLDW